MRRRGHDESLGGGHCFTGEWLWAVYHEVIYPWADGWMECGMSHILHLILLLFEVAEVSFLEDLVSLSRLVDRLYILHSFLLFSALVELFVIHHLGMVMQFFSSLFSIGGACWALGPACRSEILPFSVSI